MLEKIRIPPGLSRFKWPGLILALGVVLLLLPGRSQNQTMDVPDTAQEAEAFQLDTFTAHLEELLGHIQGAGKVELLLSLEDDGVSVYQTDETQGQGADTSQQSSQTVFSKQNGDEVPVTRQRSYPGFRGAVVLCQGAGSPSVVLEIKEAIASLTGLGMDHITVCQRN